MQSRKAFTLIELLIYIGAFSLFSLIVFGFLINAQNKLLFSNRQNENQIKTSIAIDLLKRDVFGASQNRASWDDKNFIFKKTILNTKEIKTVCIGWSASNDGLSRIQGEYDFLSHKWLKKVTSKVCFNITNISLLLNSDKEGNKVENVEIKYGQKDSEFSTVLYLRNGRGV